MSKNSLKKDYFWNTIGVFLQNGTTILLLVAITRINGIDASGLFSFASAVAIVFFAFGLWGGRLYQVSDIKKEFDHRSYIVARVLLAAVMMVGAVMFVMVNNYDEYKGMIIITLVAYKAIESIADSIYGVLQIHGELSYVGKSLFYKSTLGLLLFVGVDLLTGNIILSSLAIILVNLIFIWLYDIRIAMKLENIKLKISKMTNLIHEAGRILRRTVTIFAVTFLATFSINIPRFFIDKYDADQIGYFGIIAMPITLIALIMSFILQPNIVQLTKMFESVRYDDLRRVVGRVMQITLSFGFFVAACTFMLGIPVLNLVFGVDFTQHKLELMIMVVGGIANAFVAIYINLLTIMRKFKAQFYTLLLSNAGLVLMCIVFVRSHGILAGVSLFAVINVIQVGILAKVYHTSLRSRPSR